MPAIAAMMVPLLLVFNMDDASWKSVVEPVELMLKSVEVAKVALVDAMVKTLP